MSLTEQARYYDQLPELWATDFQTIPAERERLEKTIGLIPEDARSILDVGCGNGAFLNALPERYEKVGVDHSAEALKHVRAKTELADIRSLAFPDDAFDLVSCLEVLEHLPQEDFAAATREIARVSRKHILVSVPNRQDLDLLLVICPACRCHFNPTHHVRSFDDRALENLFPGYTARAIEEIGPYQTVPTLHRAAAAGYRTLLGEPLPSNALCPQCGYQGRPKEAAKSAPASQRPPAGRRVGLLRAGMSPLRAVSRLLWRPQQRRRWLIALYTRAAEQS